MEPLVLYDGNLSPLFQARVLVVNLLYQLTVTPYEVDFGDGDVHVVEDDSFEVEFLDLPFQRFLAPHVVFVVAVDESRQRHLRRLELHAAVHGGVYVPEIVGGVVAGLEHGAFTLQLLHGYHAGRVGMHGHTYAVVVDNVLRKDVWVATVSAGVGQDDVGIAALEGLQGYAPVFHHKITGQVQLFHHCPNHFYVAARGLSPVVQELVGCLVPVADNYHRPLLGILVGELLGRCRECHGTEQQDCYRYI